MDARDVWCVLYWRRAVRQIAEVLLDLVRRTLSPSMLAMDASGACAASRAAPASDPLVEHAFEGEAALRMWASPVRRADELDSDALLRVPLPLPFGRQLLLAPVTWARADGAPLTAARAGRGARPAQGREAGAPSRC